MPLTQTTLAKLGNVVETFLRHDLPALSRRWDFDVARAMYDIVKAHAEFIKDYEAYHLYMQKLQTIFYKLPLSKKWQAFSLMLEHQTNGGVANELNSYFKGNLTKTQMQTLVRTCPDPLTQKALEDYLHLLYKD